MTEPVKKLPIGKVPSYLHQEFDVDVSRQTVYNWIKDGKRGVKLKAYRHADRMYTTKEHVDEFVRSVGIM